jgi:hypothetical protein
LSSQELQQTCLHHAEQSQLKRVNWTISTHINSLHASKSLLHMIQQWLTLLNDEDIAMLDTPTLWSSPSCNSSPTQLPRHPQIQQTRRPCFGHNFLIRHRNGAFLDALEKGRWRRRFGSGPSSRRSVDHSVWPRQGVASPI